jgi:hypothetical protein
MNEQAEGTAEPLRCSARGCAQEAEFALRWNNPKIHPAARRKTWLACADHRASLTEYLSVRGMFRESEPVGPNFVESTRGEAPPP